MSIDVFAAVSASSTMRCMLSEPPTGELPNICASMSPAVAESFGKYSAPCSTRPVALIQLSMNTACICATTGPSALKWVSRQGGSPLQPVAPFDAHAHAAGEPDLAVDDQQLAVRAVVEPAEVIPGRRVIDLQVASGGARRREQRADPWCASPASRAACAPARRGARPFDSSSTKVAPMRVAEHEGLERDVGLRRADGVEHRRIDLRAVDQRRDLVAGDQRRARAGCRARAGNPHRRWCTAGAGDRAGAFRWWRDSRRSTARRR